MFVHVFPGIDARPFDAQVAVTLSSQISLLPNLMIRLFLDEEKRLEMLKVDHAFA